MSKKRAMSSEQASLKKTKGHLVEQEFASLINGEVNAGAQQKKKDVIDKNHCSHSVKSGKYWQIFLYRRSRWESNTVFKGLGNISKIMIECLDSFPEDREDYLSNKHKYKIQLQVPMLRLLFELKKENILGAFLSKALFNDGEVDYLTIMRSDNIFHIFNKDEVVKTLENNVNLANSRARKSNEYDCQKVLLKLPKNKNEFVNVGEIEMRTDSKQHYREMKCRFHGLKTFEFLASKIIEREVRNPRIIVYGKAIKTFKFK